MRPPHSLLLGLKLAGSLLLSPLAATEPSSPEAAEQAVLRWSELQAESSRLEAEWQWQEGVLRSTHDALQQRQQQLEQEREALEAAHAPQLAELRELARRNDESRAGLAQTNEAINALTARILATRKRLPPRLAAAIELPARSLADPRLPLADRVQHLAAIQARCAQFARMTTYAEEVIELEAGEPPRLCEVIYWGLAAAYALDRDGARALVGTPAPEGWRWESRPEITAEVEKLVLQHRDRREPEFISLPLQVIP